MNKSLFFLLFILDDNKQINQIEEIRLFSSSNSLESWQMAEMPITDELPKTDDVVDVVVEEKVPVTPLPTTTTTTTTMEIVSAPVVKRRSFTKYKKNSFLFFFFSFLRKINYRLKISGNCIVVHRIWLMYPDQNPKKTILPMKIHLMKKKVVVFNVY